VSLGHCGRIVSFLPFETAAQAHAD
jgi:hypothetical protein